PYVPCRRPAEGSVGVAEDRQGARRRSVYLQQRRTQVVPLLQLFDAPSVVGSCGARTTSTVPLQALALLNSEFARRRAEALARRVQREAGADPGHRLALAFLLTVGRQPTPEEAAAAQRVLAAQARVDAGQKDERDGRWADLCQMIRASNAFLYVEWAVQSIDFTPARRAFLTRNVGGLGALALAHLLGAEAGAAPTPDPLAPKVPHHKPRA